MCKEVNQSLIELTSLCKCLEDPGKWGGDWFSKSIDGAGRMRSVEVDGRIDTLVRVARCGAIGVCGVVF